jgi:hypothetical protein
MWNYMQGIRSIGVEWVQADRLSNGGWLPRARDRRTAEQASVLILSDSMMFYFPELECFIVSCLETQANSERP